jgi:two-component system sensor kinase
LEWLPQEAIDLLKVGAVLGREFELAFAARLASQRDDTAFRALEEARRRQLVWEKPSATHYVFVHDKVRESLLARIDEAQRRALHLRAARHLEQQLPDQIFELAYHFDAAGQSDEAFTYALAAAEQARAQHALEIAEQHYRIAMKGADRKSASLRYRIAEGLGDVLMLRGEYNHAAQMFEGAKFIAREIEGGTRSKAQIEGKLGEVAFKRGDMQRAAYSIQRALRLLGCYVPNRPRGFVLLAAWEAGVQALHSILPRSFLARRKLGTPQADTDLLAMRLYSRLAYAYWFAKGIYASLWAHLREMNLAERYPPTLELAQAYSEHAPAMSMVPYARRGIAYAERSLAIRKDFGDLWGQGQSLHFYGLVLYGAGRYEECIERCREAVRLLERTGDRWEVNIARHQIAASLFRLGRLRDAAEEAQRIRNSALELGDEGAAGFCLDIWARATAGKIPAEIIDEALRRPSADVQRTAQVLLAKGVFLLSQERYDQAVDALKTAGQRVRQAGMRNVFVAPLLPLLTTALRLQCEQIPAYAPARRKRLLQQAHATARRALWVARFFRNELPHVHRELAWLHAMKGKERAARRSLDKSLDLAQRRCMLYEQAITHLCCGTIGQQYGWKHAEKEKRRGEEMLQQLRGDERVSDRLEDSDAGSGVATLSLVDRFDTVLEAGRKIAAKLETRDILQEACKTALRLLRGQQCVVARLCERGESIELAPLAGDIDVYSTTLVRRAVAEGHAVTAAENILDRSESLVLSEALSAICAPIRVRGAVRCVFYLAHRDVVELFGEDELRLADFVATITGAALENAENYTRLDQLNRSLEQRVKERTADLESRTRELARSNADLEQFAYVASHDLQEPLRTLTNYCQLVRRRYASQLDEKAAEFLDVSIDGALRMRRLIGDLLAYSRVGTRGKPLQPTNMAEVLNLALANLRMAIEETDTVITHGPMPVVMGDAVQLVQVLQNLIGNGVKFRGPQRPKIELGVERQNDEFVFSIRDNGIGIREEDLERVFLIFQRLHPRERYEGTGIGLALCKKTIQRHGGQIWVESKVGEGSVFYFTLPAADDKLDR